MCLAVPGKVIKIEGDTAVADFNGIKKEVNISLIEVALGEYVVVHAGFAIEKIDKESATEDSAFLN